MASEEGKFNENALPEAYTDPQQRMEKQAKNRKIKAFVEWIDDLPNKGVVHLLELLEVNEDAKSAAKAMRIQGDAWAASFNRKLDTAMITELQEMYLLSSIEIHNIKRKFDQ